MFRDFKGMMVATVVVNLLILGAFFYGCAWLIQVYFAAAGG